jgi:ribosomal protein S26
MRLVLSLWEWAETAKRAFADHGNGHSKVKSEVSKVLPKSDAITDFLLERYGMNSETALELLNQIKVTRQEVICQIEGKVSQCIACANALIRSKLHNVASQKSGGGSQEQALYPFSVDCVSVVGNGSRFPYILEQIRNRIQVPFLRHEEDA